MSVYSLWVFFCINKWIIFWKNLFLKYWIIWHRPQLCGHSPGLCRYTGPWYFVRRFCELHGCLPHHNPHPRSSPVWEISVQFSICLVEEDVSMCNTITTGGTDFSRGCEPYCVTRSLRCKHIWDLLAYLMWFEGTIHFAHPLHCPFLFKVPRGNGHFTVLFGGPSPEWLCECLGHRTFCCRSPLLWGGSAYKSKVFTLAASTRHFSCISFKLELHPESQQSMIFFCEAQHKTPQETQDEHDMKPTTKGIPQSWAWTVYLPPTHGRSTKWNEA